MASWIVDGGGISGCECGSYAVVRSGVVDECWQLSVAASKLHTVLNS
jgi:hypothetical protein